MAVDAPDGGAGLQQAAQVDECGLLLLVDGGCCHDLLGCGGCAGETSRKPRRA